MPSIHRYEPSREIDLAHGGKSKDRGESENPIAIRVHRPSRRERLGPGSSRIDTSILHPASHPIEPPSLNHDPHSENATLSRPLVYSTGLHPAHKFRYSTIPDHQCRPYHTQPHAKVYSQRAPAIARGGIPALRVRYRDRATRARTGARTDRVRDDVYALERQGHYHLPGLHAQVVQQPAIASPCTF